MIAVFKLLSNAMVVVATISIVILAPAQNRVLDIDDPSLEADSLLLEIIDACTTKWQQLIRSDIDSSLIYANKTVELSRALGNDSLLFHSLRRAASSLTQKGSFREAREVCDKMLSILDTGDLYQVFRYHQTLGLVDFYEGKYEASLQNHFKALEATKQGNLQNDIPAALAEISRVFDEMGQPLKALDYAKQDLNFTMKHGGDRSKFIAQYNLANRYVELDSFEVALVLYNRADSIAQQLTVPVFLDAVMLSKGRLFYQMGKPQDAIPLLENASARMKLTGNRRGYLTALINLGQALNDLRQYERSAELLQEAYSSLTQDGFQHLAQSCREAYAEALYHTGKGENAYQLLNEYRIIQDSIKSEATSRTINDLEIQYQTAEKEKQLLEQKIALAQKTKQRNLLMSLTGLLILIALFIYFYQKEKIRQNKELAQKENEIQNQKIDQLENEKKILAMASMIEGQENERTRIAKDLHDGLGVLLSSVRRQVQNIHKEIEKLTELDIIGDTEKLINTACEEVRRISHDMMPDALMNLGLAEAIKDLAYQIEFDHGIKTHVIIPEIELREITSINIYRIIQEFCNNTIKYANASNIYLRLIKTPSALKINLADDGVGFDLTEAKSKSGVGIKSIQSRVKYLNGFLDIEATNGTSYDIVIPLQ
ncbi:MAG: tetratricopeptide repeat protein [Saprospiraceae bacterium]|nr:tetratricopeptide repeat protein [Saprospiraceae bacterium]